MRRLLNGERTIDWRKILLVSLLVSYGLHALWGFAFSGDLRDRAERRDLLNDLACSIANDAQNSQNVTAARNGPGDSQLAAAKRRLVLAALEVNPSCVIRLPEPDEENP